MDNQEELAIMERDDEDIFTVDDFKASKDNFMRFQYILRNSVTSASTRKEDMELCREQMTTFWTKLQNLTSQRGENSEPSGTRPCGQCSYCHYIYTLNAMDFPFRKYYQFRGVFNCESENVIYVINCKKCDRPYIGSTRKKLSERFAKHLNDIEKQNAGTAAASHFMKDDHIHTFKDDIEVAVIKKVETGKDLRSIENKFIEKLGTMKPNGLNVRLDFSSLPMEEEDDF